MKTASAASACLPFARAEISEEKVIASAGNPALAIDANRSRAACQAPDLSQAEIAALAAAVSAATPREGSDEKSSRDLRGLPSRASWLIILVRPGVWGVVVEREREGKEGRRGLRF